MIKFSLAFLVRAKAVHSLFLYFPYPDQFFFVIGLKVSPKRTWLIISYSLVSPEKLSGWNDITAGQMDLKQLCANTKVDKNSMK